MHKVTKISRAWGEIKTKMFYGFSSVGEKSIVFHPMQIDSSYSISIGNRVFVAEGAWLMGAPGNDNTLTIGDGTVIGHLSHIVALSGVTIGKNVLLADRVYISDCAHQYEDIGKPVIFQEVKILKKIRIGDDSWIGENVCIIGASIGKHCVIGANAVVTKDIPDYCVAVGAPARVIKKYDFDTGEWKKVKQ